jgi:hypothetical protein
VSSVAKVQAIRYNADCSLPCAGVKGTSNTTCKPAEAWRQLYCEVTNYKVIIIVQFLVGVM